MPVQGSLLQLPYPSFAAPVAASDCSLMWFLPYPYSAAPYTHSNNVYQQPSTTMIVAASSQAYYQPQPQQLTGLPGHHLPELDARQMGHPGTRASPTTVSWIL